MGLLKGPFGAGTEVAVVPNATMQYYEFYSGLHKAVGLRGCFSISALLSTEYKPSENSESVTC